jgi:tRNA(Arg) A34 adenosine deaminase TadA
MFCYMCFGTVIIVHLRRVVWIRFYCGFCPLA